VKVTIGALLLIVILSAIHQPMWAAAIAALLVVYWAFGRLFRSIRRR
jgi:hypothetical protein